MTDRVQRPLPHSKSALVLIPRLVTVEDRARMLRAFERHARDVGAPQVGANHVLEVILKTRYFVKYGAGLQGGPGSGPRDPTRDHEGEREWLLKVTFPQLEAPPGGSAGDVSGRRP